MSAVRRGGPDELVRHARLHVLRKYGRPDPAGLQLVLVFHPDGSVEDRLEVIPTPAGAEPSPFVPSPLQKAVMKALAGRGRRTDDLAATVGCDRRRLFKAGGLPELLEEDWVRHHHRVGYYSTFEPPPDLPPGLTADLPRRPLDPAG